MDPEKEEKRRKRRAQSREMFINRTNTLSGDEIFVKIPAYTRISILGSHMTTVKDTWVKMKESDLELPWDLAWLERRREFPEADILRKEDLW